MDIQLDILNEKEAAILRETIAASQRIVICAHKSPDGDAVGSSLGWAYFLRSLGKKPVICGRSSFRMLFFASFRVIIWLKKTNFLS